MRRLLALAIVLVVVVPAASAAAAPLSFGTCRPALRGFRCATLPVPLDRSGAVPGTIGIRVARQAHAPRGAGVLVALAGGPGQSAVPFAASYAQTLSPALKRYRLVVVDQRGTGDSGALSCPGLQQVRGLDPDLALPIAACAATLGPRRDHYSTIDSVDDLEALRVALGAPKLALQGTSYGTYVAVQYARKYPARTDRLVLDSSVGPDGVDALLLDSWAPLPRILRSQCAGSLCRGITRDPVAAVRALSARLVARPLRGTVLDGHGRRRKVSLTAGGLANLIMAGDLAPHLQAATPAAIRSALNGDARPLLRLVAPAVGAPFQTKEISIALNVATTCADTRLAYGPTTPFADRPALMQAALLAAPDAALGPFTRPVVERLSVDRECQTWPPGAVAGPVDTPIAAVPTLILGGTLDVRTPLENDRALAALIPGAQLVAVPGSGHDEIDSDLNGCVRRALVRFFADRRVGDPCAGPSYAVPPQPVAPRSVAATPRAHGVAGARGRVLEAAVGTIDDARESSLQRAEGGLRDRVGGGLRAGTWRTVGDTTFVLKGLSWVPGVRIDGAIDSRLGRYAGTVRVRAPHGLGGTLTFDRRTGVSGTLGGRPVRLAARYARGAVPPALLAR